MPQTIDQRCGWVGRISDFLTSDKTSWLEYLKVHHQRCMLMAADESQIRAWRNCFPAMYEALQRLTHTRPEANQWGIVFEYELPRERGRRPDVLLLAGADILVLEFKDRRAVLQAHIDQVAAYARDLAAYHGASHQCKLIPVLVLTQGPVAYYEVDGVCVTPASGLAEIIQAQVLCGTQNDIDPQAWINADYDPLPSLVAAARNIFQHEPLPQIRRANSAGIPQTIARLLAIADQAEANNEHHLCPGNRCSRRTW